MAYARYVIPGIHSIHTLYMPGTKTAYICCVRRLPQRTYTAYRTTFWDTLLTSIRLDLWDEKEGGEFIILVHVQLQPISAFKIYDWNTSPEITIALQFQLGPRTYTLHHNFLWKLIGVVLLGRTVCPVTRDNHCSSFRGRELTREIQPWASPPGGWRDVSPRFEISGGCPPRNRDF